jgi:hypothetical protein
MLNNPGEELVLSDGFLAMVERLDSCLTYLKSHVSPGWLLVSRI